jgi:co-chaperonin GroES (HSP10)
MESGMKLRLLRNLVLVKLDPKQGITPAGIILPHVSQDQPTTGTVIDAGPEAECKPGWRVVFGKWNGIACLEDHHAAAMGHPGAELYVMREKFDQQVGKHTLVGDHIYGVLEAD